MLFGFRWVATVYSKSNIIKIIKIDILIQWIQSSLSDKDSKFNSIFYECLSNYSFLYFAIEFIVNFNSTTLSKGLFRSIYEELYKFKF